MKIDVIAILLDWRRGARVRQLRTTYHIRPEVVFAITDTYRQCPQIPVVALQAGAQNIAFRCRGGRVKGRNIQRVMRRFYDG